MANVAWNEMLGGGFEDLACLPLHAEMIQFDLRIFFKTNYSRMSRFKNSASGKRGKITWFLSSKNFRNLNLQDLQVLHVKCVFPIERLWACLSSCLTVFFCACWVYFLSWVKITLPETNSKSTWKIDDWKFQSFRGNGQLSSIFSGAKVLFISGQLFFGVIPRVGALILCLVNQPPRATYPPLRNKASITGLINHWFPLIPYFWGVH